MSISLSSLSFTKDCDDHALSREDRGHAQELLRSFCILKEQKVLTDITIISGNTTVDAHRVVLTAGSAYFRACFTNSFIESNSDKKVLNLSHIAEDSLEAIVNYIYTGRIDIKESNYLSLLDSANQLELPKLVNLCGDFLLSRLDMENCIGIHILAETYACLALATYSEQFIYRNFENIIYSDEFVNLTVERVLNYIGSDELSVSKEEVVFEAIVRWINYDVDNRKQHIDKLISKLRLELVSPQFIAQAVHQYEHVKENQSSLKCVLDSYQWHCLPDSLKASPLKNHLRMKAIRPCIYIFGGDDGHNDSQPFGTCMYLDTLLDEWVTAAPLLRPRSVSGSAVIGNKLYVVGGYDGDRATDSVEAFDCTTNTWTLMPPISQRRCSCSCAVLQGKVYVIGGVCGPLALQQVECFDPVAAIWSNTAPLLHCRSACGVAAVNDFIVVAGGINSQGDTVASAEIFSLETGEWREIAPMCCPRRSFALCQWNGLLHAIGGNDGTMDLWTVEIYDAKLNEWRLCEGMTSCRMYCSATTFNDCIYAAGGMSGSTTLQTMEKYYPSLDKWETVTPLPRSICGCGIQILNSVPRGALANGFRSYEDFSFINGLQELSTQIRAPSPFSPTPPVQEIDTADNLLATVSATLVTQLSTSVITSIQEGHIVSSPPALQLTPNRTRYPDLDESKGV